jgi:hypothetical protein
MKIAVPMLIALTALTTLSGCSTASVKAHSMGNVRGFVINCSGMTTGWDSCYSKAESVCSTHGYKTVSKTTDVKEEEGDSFLGFSPGRYSRTLVIACKLPTDT